MAAVPGRVPARGRQGLGICDAEAKREGLAPDLVDDAGHGLAPEHEKVVFGPGAGEVASMILALQRRVEVDDAGEVPPGAKASTAAPPKGLDGVENAPYAWSDGFAVRVEERDDDAGREDSARHAGWRRSAGLANLANPNRPKV